MDVWNLNILGKYANKQILDWSGQDMGVAKMGLYVY